jgi:hypothetical protein
VTLLDVIARSSQVKNGRVVRVDQPHLETVTNDLQLARVGGSLKGDGVDEATNSTVLVFPVECKSLLHQLRLDLDPSSKTQLTRWR